MSLHKKVPCCCKIRTWADSSGRGGWRGPWRRTRPSTSRWWLCGVSAMPVTQSSSCGSSLSCIPLNAFNGYSYLKSTRKELSDGTLMLKKEYRLARWNCDWKSYTFPKKYPPARENDQNSTKSTKWLKITFRGSKMVPKVSKWGFWGGICIEKWS